MNKLAISIVGIGVIMGVSPFVLDKTTLNTGQDTFYSNLSVVDTQGNNTSMGINSDPEFHFGQMPEDTNVTKKLNLSSNKTVLASIDTEGNISERLKYNGTYYFEGRQQIPIEARAKELGYYEGNITVKTQTPRNGAGERWLDLKSSFY